MARELSTEFKTAFGRMLIGLKMSYTPANALNYSGTLIEYTRAGLVTMGLMGRYSDYKYAADYDKDFQRAEILYRWALQQLKMKGRNTVVEQRILEACYEINKLIFPIALSEGILVMNEEMFGVADIFMNPSAGQQSHHRK
jgi:hypothetical protein